MRVLCRPNGTAKPLSIDSSLINPSHRQIKIGKRQQKSFRLIDGNFDILPFLEIIGNIAY